MGREHVIVIDGEGNVKTLYTDLVDLRDFGTPHVERASNVEWDEEWHGWAVLFSNGDFLCFDDVDAYADPPIITYRAGEYKDRAVFTSREDALREEVNYLQERL